MKCPVCSAELPATAKFCGGCGTTLSIPPPSPPAAVSYQQSYPASNPSPGYAAGGYGASTLPTVLKKYKMLRLIAVVMKIFAVLAGGLLIIAGLVTIVAGAASSSRTAPALPDAGPMALLGGAVVGLMMLVYGVFVFIFLYAYAEWMYVFMDIEENTRVTNEMLSARK